MLYSRLFAPWLLWLVYMLTERGSGAVGGAPNGSAAGWSVGAVCSGLAESGWAALRLANCRRPIATALPQAPPRLRHCLQTMHRLIESDSQADRWLRSFNLILHRYDCGQSYSVNFNCQHCQLEVWSSLMFFDLNRLRLVTIVSDVVEVMTHITE
ncbi:hypothetical protein AAG570_000521 [Ranatra chinensis]|uniref:Secreted protein n=1 Tax=Ranatra chinensis TaxID=642074 RepID=A0ABD0YXB1_9HEMI